MQANIKQIKPATFEMISPRFLGSPPVHALLSDLDEIAVPGHSGDALLVGAAMLPSAFPTASALATQ